MDAAVAGEVLATVSGMASATKVVSEAVQALRKMVKGNRDAEQAVSDAFDQILSLRTGMLDLQEKAFSLQQELSRLQQELFSAQQENVQLREEISREKKRTTDAQQFYRKKVETAVVMVRDSEPDIAYCPACLETRGHAIPLQRIDRGREHSHMCFTCQTVFSLGRFF